MWQQFSTGRKNMNISVGFGGGIHYLFIALLGRWVRTDETMLCTLHVTHRMSNDLPISIAHYYTRIYDCTSLTAVQFAFVFLNFALDLALRYLLLWMRNRTMKWVEKKHRNDNNVKPTWEPVLRRRTVKLHEILRLEVSISPFFSVV